jgi:HEAT repeat protein
MRRKMQEVLTASLALMIGVSFYMNNMSNQNADSAPIEELKIRLYSTDQDTSSLALGDLIRMGRRSTPILLEALTNADSHPEVRARAATALYILNDPRALNALVNTLNDYPDILHNPYTASMYPLMRGGREVLPLVIPLLKSPDALTRERAFLIVQAVVTKLPEGTDWNQLWRSLGSYDPKSSETEWANAAQQWEKWLEQFQPDQN